MQMPGELGASGPSQKCGVASLTGLHVGRMHAGVAKYDSGANTVLEQRAIPGPPGVVQSASEAHFWPVVPSYCLAGMPVSGAFASMPEGASLSSKGCASLGIPTSV